METIKFKTNINCMGCVKAVTPHMEKTKGINSWQVDTESPDKILTVESEGLQSAEVKQVVENAGFKAEEITGS